MQQAGSSDESPCSGPCLYELPTSCRSWFFFSSMSRLVRVSTCSEARCVKSCGLGNNQSRAQHGIACRRTQDVQHTSRISRIVCVSNRRSAFLPTSLTLRRGDSGAEPIDPERYADRAIAARSAPLFTGKTKDQTVGASFCTDWPLRCSMSGSDTPTAHAHLPNLMLLKQTLSAQGWPASRHSTRAQAKPSLVARAGLTT